jgi:5'-nucleotidase
MARMRILLTNDDGLEAPGIAAMAASLVEFHEVMVIAPSRERSGASHALTMLEPIRVHARGEDRWAVDGTPVDCVYLGLHKLCSWRPDLVVSGINKGANVGDDVLYSGTVGAAREAALNNIPSLAVSLDTQSWPGVGSRFHFESAAAFATETIASMVADPLPAGSFLNLNVPNRPLKDIPGLEICGLGRRHYEPMVEERTDPRNHPYFWIGGEPVGDRMGDGLDGWWLHRGHASLTPLGLDSTSVEHFSQLKGWPCANKSGR